MSTPHAVDAAVATGPTATEAALGAALAAARAASAEDDWEAVRDRGEAVLAERPDDIDALFLVSLAAFHQGDLAMATSAARTALDQDAGVREFADTLAVYYALAGDLTNSLYYGKLATALGRNERFGSLVPATFPRFESVFQNISEQPLLLRARQSAAEGAWADAETWYRQHLAFNPDDAEAHLGLGACLVSAGQLRGALESLRAARHVAPHDARVASMLGNVLTMLGEYPEGRACHTWACGMGPDSAVVHAAALQDRLISPDILPAEAIAESRAWGERFGIIGEDSPPPAEMKDRLTIGYVVGNRGGSTAGMALSAILAKHDPTRYQTVGFGLGALSDEVNLTFQKCMDRWHDIDGIDPITLGAMVAAEEVDILVDVSGFAMPEHLTAFGARMAPCQATWMGAPAGTGLAAMDFVLSDAIIEADGNDGMVERPILLELGAMVTSPVAAGATAPARRDGQELIFAADANLAEINPRTAALWAHVLHAVPGSALVLRDHGYRSGDSLNRLTGLFGDFGIAHRVDIVGSGSAASFYEQADIALLPIPCPRPQAAMDALWGGTPAICLNGPGRTARQAASLISHLGLGDDMVAADPNGYVIHAVAWAADADRRNALRSTMRDRLANADALNPTKRARDLENALRTMWQRTCAQA